jgi:hypothetical protein
MKVVDPSLRTLVFDYTDTDSLRVSAKAYKQLEAGGYLGDTLGKLHNDIEQGALIYEQVNVAPKFYCIKYMLPGGELGEKVTSAGVRKHLLTADDFESHNDRVLKMAGAKFDRHEMRMKHFELSRRLAKLYTGMKLVDESYWVPHGYLRCEDENI